MVMQSRLRAPRGSEAANFAQSKIDVNVHLSLQPQSRGRRTDSPESVLFAYDAFVLKNLTVALLA